MFTIAPWSLKDIIKLVYSKGPGPSPERVRLYAVNTNGFWNVVSRFRDSLDASQRVLNPAFMPALRFLELYVNAFLRAYFLSCYYDMFVLLNLVPGNFTPSKVSYVLDQAMPKLLIDAMRELIRPQALPNGTLLIPHPQCFINWSEYDPNVIVRNSVPLGDMDQRLLSYGIQWFPRLALCFRAAWMTGTDNGDYALTLVEGTKREGLEPAKGAFVIRIFDKDNWDKDKAFRSKDAKEKKGDIPSESKMQIDGDEHVVMMVKMDEPSLPDAGVVESKKYEALRKPDSIQPKFDVSKGSGSKYFIGSVVERVVERGYVRQYLCHDFDAVEDAQRDFAFRILQPHIIYLYDDVYIGRRFVVNDMYPDDLLFMGVDIWRGALSYSIHEFQSGIVELMNGDPAIEVRDFYVARWISELSMSLKSWHFPSMNVPLTLEPVDGKSGVQLGQGRRARRNRRSPQQPAEQKTAVPPAPPVVVPPVSMAPAAMAAPGRGRGRGRGRGYRRGRHS